MKHCQELSSGGLETHPVVLASHQVPQSVGRPGSGWANAMAESFFARLKQELIYRHAWPTRKAARSARRRRHRNASNGVALLPKF